MTTCIKTGCHAYLREYNEYVYGDAHQVDGVLIIAVVERSFKPILPRIHFEVHHINVWLVENQRASFLIAATTCWTQKGDYDGVPCPQP